MTSLIKDFYLETFNSWARAMYVWTPRSLLRQGSSKDFLDWLMPFSHPRFAARSVPPRCSFSPSSQRQNPSLAVYLLNPLLTCDPCCSSCCHRRLKLPPSSPWLPRYIGTHSNQNAGLSSAVVRLQREEESLILGRKLQWNSTGWCVGEIIWLAWIDLHLLIRYSIASTDQRFLHVPLSSPS